VFIQQLQYLTALAREGHFGRAADACFVTQPTLSSGIRRLEQELGVALVRRGRRYEGLTPEGEAMLEWAHRLLADVDGMRSDIEAMRAGISGRLRLGVIPTSLSVITAVTGPLVRRHPGIDLSLQSLTSREIEQGLRESQLDAGITYLANEPLRGVRTLTLYEEHYVLLTPATDTFADRDEVTWAEVATERLCLLTPDMQNRRIVDGIFAGAGAGAEPDGRDELDLDALRPRPRGGRVGGHGPHVAAPVPRAARHARDSDRQPRRPPARGHRVARPPARTASRARVN
jgi:DNA-binding transcriptional LysR family regulator